MEKIFMVSLSLHIIAGLIAFVAAPVAMIVTKGSRQHRIFGKIFFWSMTGVSATAFIMAVLQSNLFLFIVSGFSYYLIASGYRWIYRKKVTTINEIAGIDQVLIICASIFNISLFIYGCYLLYTRPQIVFSYISICFGMIGMAFVAINLKQYLHPPKRNFAWVLNHIGGMVGGYIATISAFSAVNFNFLPTIVQWLWPSIIGVPLLVLWIRYYWRKFEKKQDQITLSRILGASEVS